MWKSTVGVPLKITDDPDDDWETDPDFENNVSEEEQRWGSKTIPGSGRIGDAIEYVSLCSGSYSIMQSLPDSNFRYISLV